MNRTRRKKLRGIVLELMSMRESGFDWLGLDNVLTDCNYKLDELVMEEEKALDSFPDNFRYCDEADRMYDSLELMSGVCINMDFLHKDLMTHHEWKYADIRPKIVEMVNELNAIIEQ